MEPQGISASARPSGVARDGPTFRVRLVVVEGAAVLVLVGDLDADGAPWLLATARNVLARGQADLVVDLGELDSFSAAGADAVAELHRLASAAGGGLTVRGASPSVEAVVEDAGLGHLVDRTDPTAVAPDRANTG